MPIKSSFAVFALMLLFSCQEDAVAPVKEPNPLMGYLVSFLEEAEKRGVEIDTLGMTLELGAPLWMGPCGWGNAAEPGFPPFVRICKTCACWRNGDNFFKSELLFHEFGHALLDREHDNTSLPNGSRKSIMNATFVGVFWQSEEKLKYYIDELFDPTTPVPNWAN